MAYIGNIKDKKKVRKHLVTTGKFPDGYEFSMMKTIEEKKFKFLTIMSYGFYISAIVNLILIWRISG